MRLGGSGAIAEIVEDVLKREGFSEQQQAVLHGTGPQTEIGYRLAWVRTLKGMGLHRSYVLKHSKTVGVDNKGDLPVMRRRPTVQTIQVGVANC
ncbi:hypothetical protein Acsp03_63700 [Actinomadura sp. NBRC 104412]|nr:hypothetical protein Acsp03_63700 [Actinomadura sp. NBRC 104412]